MRKSLFIAVPPPLLDKMGVSRWILCLCNERLLLALLAAFALGWICFCLYDRMEIKRK